jgi:hypothetical protein
MTAAARAWPSAAAKKHAPIELATVSCRVFVAPAVRGKTDRSHRAPRSPSRSRLRNSAVECLPSALRCSEERSWLTFRTAAGTPRAARWAATLCACGLAPTDLEVQIRHAARRDTGRPPPRYARSPLPVARAVSPGSPGRDGLIGATSPPPSRCCREEGRRGVLRLVAAGSANGRPRLRLPTPAPDGLPAAVWAVGIASGKAAPRSYSEYKPRASEIFYPGSILMATCSSKAAKAASPSPIGAPVANGRSREGGYPPGTPCSSPGAVGHVSWKAAAV